MLTVLAMFAARSLVSLDSAISSYFYPFGDRHLKQKTWI